MPLQPIKQDRTSLLKYPVIHSANFGCSPEMRIILDSVDTRSARVIENFAQEIQHGEDRYELGIIEHRRVGLRMVIAPTDTHPICISLDELGGDWVFMLAFVAAFQLVARWGSPVVSYVHLGQECWSRIDMALIADRALGGGSMLMPRLSEIRVGHMTPGLIQETVRLGEEFRDSSTQLWRSCQPALGDEVQVYCGFHGFTVRKVDMLIPGVDSR